MNATLEPAAAPGRPGPALLAAPLAAAAAVVALDQWTKHLAQQELTLGGWREITAWFNLALAYNRGAAFSFLDNAGSWQGYLFLAIALGASVVIVHLLRQPGHSGWMRAALALILGGALGNAIDRLRYGHVVDFLDFHWSWLGGLFPGGHFPAFNVADSAISAGVTLLLLDELLRWRRR